MGLLLNCICQYFCFIYFIDRCEICKFARNIKDYNSLIYGNTERSGIRTRVN